MILAVVVDPGDPDGNTAIPVFYSAFSSFLLEVNHYEEFWIEKIT
jgi:hypothetical protein